MKQVSVQEAVGMVLCHDITRIVPGQFKGTAFKKGHVIKQGDIDKLLDLGKENIFVWECVNGMLHENEAAIMTARAAAGDGIELMEPNQGRVNLKAAERGLLKINTSVLNKVNTVGQVMISTRHNNTLVEKGDIVAGAKIIPLVIAEEKIKTVKDICNDGEVLAEVRPFKTLKVGMVTTGSEVYHGRIKDGFGPVVKKKIEEYGSEVFEQVFVPDNKHLIKEAIERLLASGAELIVTTGGMSVDPDDVTPGAVKETGAEIVTYGTPLMPGAMFLLAYKGDVPVIGLPGCVMYSKTTVFDLVLPRIFAGERIKEEDITRMGHGGLCLECPECHYPNCVFGKGC
ncbi:MAG: molybdopterin-binding protein [Nitrospiraceae bacterium]|nr:MAG: molybdopterin-binding protein [Nitrospiraceae bacterium]